MVGIIPCFDFLEKTQCFPFYTYDEDGSNRRENITDWALSQFQSHYEDSAITKWDIFHYVYGILHHAAYRERYQANLKRDLPRLPYASDFRGLPKRVNAWRASTLIMKRCPNIREMSFPYASSRTRKFNSVGASKRCAPPKTKRRLSITASLIIDGIPAKAFEYRLGNRSALEWVIDQYRVKTDKRSGIVNDPNRHDDPRYIVKLIRRLLR